MKFFQRLTAAICIGLMGASVSVNAAEGKFLADRHVAKGLPCTSFHVKDGSAELKIDDQKHEACVGCHGWYDAVSKRTQPKNPEEVNPHSQHDGNLPCTECHKGHKPGVNYCGECHMYTFKVP